TVSMALRRVTRDTGPAMATTTDGGKGRKRTAGRRRRPAASRTAEAPAPPPEAPPEVAGGGPGLPPPLPPPGVAPRALPPTPRPPPPTPPPPRPASRRVIFLDVENTSRPQHLAHVIDHLALDRRDSMAELFAVANWKVISHDSARLLAQRGAQLVHSAPSTGV